MRGRISRLPLAAATLFVLLASCRSASRTHDDAPGPFDWTIGEWHGVRRDGDGLESEAPLFVRVEPILAGAGQIEHITVTLEDGASYRGFSVQMPDRALGRWTRQYVNSTSGRFVPQEGEVEGERSVWRGVSPVRTRESRLISVRVPPDGWRRTMAVSEDGGATWRTLFVDELRAGRR
jgi:hypothetical protein